MQGSIYGRCLPHTVNHHRAAHITESATFPWHDQLCPCHVMFQQNNAIAIQDEGRLELGCQAYTSGQFKSLRRAAIGFNVTHQRLSDRLREITSRAQTQPNCRKLTVTEEQTII